MPITVAELYMVCNVFAHLIIGIVVSNLTRGMDVYLRFSYVCVFWCREWPCVGLISYSWSLINYL